MIKVLIAFKMQEKGENPYTFSATEVRYEGGWVILVKEEKIPYRQGDDKTRRQLTKTTTRAFPAELIAAVETEGEPW